MMKYQQGEGPFGRLSVLLVEDELFAQKLATNVL
jgi:hypothetical protein